MFLIGEPKLQCHGTRLNFELRTQVIENLALMTLRMLWLLLFMSISSFLVSPFSASRAMAGVAISPYLNIFLINSDQY